MKQMFALALILGATITPAIAEEAAKQPAAPAPKVAEAPAFKAPQPVPVKPEAAVPGKTESQGKEAAADKDAEKQTAEATK